MRKTKHSILGLVLLLALFVNNAQAHPLHNGTSNADVAYFAHDHQTEFPSFETYRILHSSAFLVPSSEHAPSGGGSFNPLFHFVDGQKYISAFYISLSCKGSRLYGLLHTYMILFPFHSFW